MPSLIFRKFSETATLRAIYPPTLVAFLRPYEAYLAAHRIGLDSELDYDRLIALLAHPGGDVPPDLVDALYLVHECSNDDDADALIEAGTPIGGEPSPTCTDIAILAWLINPELLRDRHALSTARRQRNFLYFGGTREESTGVAPTLTPETVGKLEQAFDDWFEDHHRGRKSKVLHFPDRNKLLIVIRHGQRRVREASHEEDGTTGVTVYRPQKCDVLRYDPAEDVIAVHGQRLDAAVPSHRGSHVRP